MPARSSAIVVVQSDKYSSIGLVGAGGCEPQASGGAFCDMKVRKSRLQPDALVARADDPPV
jgi:hypothetical protein